MKPDRSVELKILKSILWTYIIMCLAIAGLNYGYAPKATPAAAHFIAWFWQFYENVIKTVFIIVGSFLTLRIVNASRRSAFHKRNLIGLTISALVVHIITPLLLHNQEIYFFTMPLPWTTTPLQLLYPQSSFYQSNFPIWGTAGISAALIVYGCFSLVVIVGTLLFGRRWQCSTLCLFNGFASEVFAPAMPLLGKQKSLKKPLEQGTVRFLAIFKWIFFAISIGFSLWWILFLAGAMPWGDFQAISKIETYKYLSTELLMAMFFWVALVGRGYCYYCPLGTFLAVLGKLAGQKITTNQTKCISCGQCNKICPMSIDIKGPAQTGSPVKHLNCVGCGHCIDVCPTKTLNYATKFLDWFKSRHVANN